MSDQDSPEPHGLTAMNGWWAASGFLILLVVLGVAYVLIWGGDDQAPAATPAAPTPNVSMGTDTTSQDGLPDADEQIPTVAPSGVTWGLYLGVAMPGSDAAGPTSRAKGIWSGYAHTPTGALLAAAYLDYAVVGPNAAAVLSQRTVRDVNQEAALAQAQVSPPATPAPGQAAAVAGFRFKDYSPSAATVQIGGSAGNINMYAEVPLRWVDGDWKLDLTKTGLPLPSAGVSSLTGFVPWGAASG